MFTNFLYVINVHVLIGSYVLANWLLSDQSYLAADMAFHRDCCVHWGGLEHTYYHRLDRDSKCPKIINGKVQKNKQKNK